MHGCVCVLTFPHPHKHALFGLLLSPLQNYFKPYGELVTFKIFNRLDRDPSLKGQAFVQLKTQELAQKAATVCVCMRARACSWACRQQQALGYAMVDVLLYPFFSFSPCRP